MGRRLFMPDLRTLEGRRAVATRGSSWPEALGKEGVTGTLVPVQEGRLRRFGLSEETPVPALRDGVSFQSVFGQMTECY